VYFPGQILNYFITHAVSLLLKLLFSVSSSSRSPSVVPSLLFHSFQVNMKSILAPALLASMAAGAAIDLDKRQFGLNTMLSSVIGLMPGTNGVVQDAKAQLRPDAKRIIIKYGPFTLPGNKVWKLQSLFCHYEANLRQDAEAPKEAGHAHGSGGSMGSMPGMSEPAKPKSGGGFADVLGSLAGSKPMDPNGVGVVKRLATGMPKVRDSPFMYFMCSMNSTAIRM
jgi:hypothetical protein